jgi:hypothetical protein
MTHTCQTFIQGFLISPQPRHSQIDQWKDDALVHFLSKVKRVEFIDIRADDALDLAS